MERRKVHGYVTDQIMREAGGVASRNEVSDLAYNLLVEPDGKYLWEKSPGGKAPIVSVLKRYANRRYSADNGIRLSDVSPFSRWSPSAEARDLQGRILTAKPLVIAGGVATVGILGTALYFLIRAPSSPQVPTDGTSSGGAPLGLGGLAGCLVDHAIGLLPSPDSILGMGDPRWDAAMGGVKSPGKWGLYETGFGTTCAVFLGYLLSLCKAPTVLINRPAPEGSGFEIGAHISKLYSGAKSLGWLMLPSGGKAQLQAGDMTCTHNPTTNSEHVELVLSALDDGSGTQAIEAAAGGQTDAQGRQCAKRVQRSLSGTTMTRAGVGSSSLIWWVRPPKG